MTESNTTTTEYTFDPPWYPLSHEKFRLAAKTMLLTYIDYRGTLNELRNAINWCLRNYKIVQYVFVLEEDKGNTHAHVYLELEKKLDTRSPKFFDIVVNGHRMSGNVLRIKKTSGDHHYIGSDAIEYCLKYVYKIAPEDEQKFLISDGIKSILRRDGSVLSFNEAYIKKLEETQSVSETLDYIKDLQPDRFFNEHAKLRANMASILAAQTLNKEIELITLLLNALAKFAASKTNAIVLIHSVLIEDQNKILDILNTLLTAHNIDITTVQYYETSSYEILANVTKSPNTCLLCFSKAEWDPTLSKYVKTRIERLHTDIDKQGDPAMLILSEDKPSANTAKLLRKEDRAVIFGTNKTNKMVSFLKSAEDTTLPP
jgi:hypothetical protein